MMQCAVLCLVLYCAFWLMFAAWARARARVKEQEMELVGDPRMACPGCKRALPVDSVRRHVTGARRVYWECSECRLSIMRRP